MPLSACTLQGFELQPCEVGDMIGFRIAPIEGWFSDYDPKPDEVMVRSNDNRSYEDAKVWATRLNYSGPNDSKYEARPVRRFIVYGQKFDGWELMQGSKSLSVGQSYMVVISDGGHHGRGIFEVGKRLPAC
jgi:hypothetical protein